MRFGGTNLLLGSSKPVYSRDVSESELSARSLANQVFSLLGDHPVLAVPVVIADLVSFAATHIQRALYLYQPLLARVFGKSDSVLSATKSVTPETAVLLFLPLAWACYFLTICLYTGALLSTSAFVRSLLQGQPSQLRFALADPFRKRRRVLVFSISVFGAIVLAAILVGLSMPLILKTPGFAGMQGRDVGYFIGFLLECVFVYLFSRPALKLLRLTQNPTSAAVDWIAVVLGLTVVAAQLVIVLLIEHVEPDTLQQTTAAGFLTREAIASLIGAMVYVPLFIGLSLLAVREDQVESAEAPGDAEPAQGSS